MPIPMPGIDHSGLGEQWITTLCSIGVLFSWTDLFHHAIDRAARPIPAEPEGHPATAWHTSPPADQNTDGSMAWAFSEIPTCWSSWPCSSIGPATTATPTRTTTPNSPSTTPTSPATLPTTTTSTTRDECPVRQAGPARSGRAGCRGEPVGPAPRCRRQVPGRNSTRRTLRRVDTGTVSASRPVRYLLGDSRPAFRRNAERHGARAVAVPMRGRTSGPLCARFAVCP